MSKKIKNISILDCTDFYKHDINTSLYIYELEEKTLDYKIKWQREWNSKRNAYNYYATYTNSFGIKVKLEVLDDYNEGIELSASYSNHGKLIKTLFLTQWVYNEELDDLMNTIKKSWDYYNNSEKDYYMNRFTNPYYNKKYKSNSVSRAIVPYYNNYNNDNDKQTKSKRVKTKRGKKAEELLLNVQFEYNCQILGEKGCLEI